MRRRGAGFFPPEVCDSAIPPRFGGFALARAAATVGLRSIGGEPFGIGADALAIGLDFESAAYVLLP